MSARLNLATFVNAMAVSAVNGSSATKTSAVTALGASVKQLPSSSPRASAPTQILGEVTALDIVADSFANVAKSKRS
jgi:hypothetical protein